MQKVDFKKELKYLYNPSKKDFSIIDVPEMNFLMIDDRGNPRKSVPEKLKAIIRQPVK